MYLDPNSTSASSTLLVGPSETYTTIQSAIEAATNGDVITVAAGTYTENLNINKAVTLRCANTGISAGSIPGIRDHETNIQGEATVSVADVEIDGCRFVRPDISRFLSPKLVRSTGVSGEITVRNSIFDFTWTASDPTLGTACGAGTYGTAGWRIYDNRFLNTRYVSSGDTRCAPELYSSRAVQADAAEKIIVSGNHFFNTHQSVYLTGTKADGSEITNNLFTEAGMGGVFLGVPENVLIKGNTFDGNSGVYLDGSSGTIIENNVFNVNSTLWAAGAHSGTKLRGNSILGAYNFGPGYDDYNGKTVFNYGNASIDAASNWWGSSDGPGTRVGGTYGNLIESSSWITQFSQPRGPQLGTGFYPINPTFVSNMTAGVDVVQEFRSTTSEATTALTFANVVAPGVVSVVEYTSADALPEEPSGFSLGDPPTYFEIDTTAVFEGSVEVCITYPTNAFPAGTSPRLYHFTNNAWQDITSSFDETTQTLCGSVTSFSPFAVGQAVATPVIETPLEAPTGISPVPVALPTTSSPVLTIKRDVLQRSLPGTLKLSTTVRLLRNGAKNRTLVSRTPSRCLVVGERILALRTGNCEVEVRQLRGGSRPGPGRIVSTLRTVISSDGVQRGLVLTKRGEISFEQYSSTPETVSQAIVDASRKARGVILVGHTATFSGSSSENAKLSRLRASVVKTYLGKQNVRLNRISVVGLAAQQPITKEKTATAQQRNRRVEVYTLS